MELCGEGGKALGEGMGQAGQGQSAVKQWREKRQRWWRRDPLPPAASPPPPPPPHVGEERAEGGVSPRQEDFLVPAWW